MKTILEVASLSVAYGGHEALHDVSEEVRTLVITQNGEAKAVVMGVREYDQLQESLAMLAIASQGRADIDAGRTVPHREVVRRLRAIVKRARRGD